MREYTIYRRGGYSVVPLITGFVVRGPKGRIYAFNEQDVDGAVDLVDELAAGIGEREAA